MDADSKAELLEAVNALITSLHAKEMFSSFLVAADVAARAPICLTGAAEVLNPLLRLRMQNRPAYESAIGLVEARRALRGAPPLTGCKDSGYNKTAYMQQFMDQKREREKRIAVIENLRRPERDHLRGNHRLEFMRRQSVKWKDLRDRALEAAREEAGGTLSAVQRKELLTRFWKAVDDDLEAKLIEAKQAQLDPHRKPITDDDMQELWKALKLPPR